MIDQEQIEAMEEEVEQVIDEAAAQADADPHPAAGGSLQRHPGRDVIRISRNEGARR